MTAAGLAPVRCVRCDRAAQAMDVSRRFGCPVCSLDGRPSNYRWLATLGGVEAAWRSDRSERGMWRFREALPVETGVTLQEGDTPLVELHHLGRRWGLDRLHAKIESSNPTWSHKDRLASVTVSVAALLGAKVLAAASTGNHGAAIAAYAARAGLHCIIATLESVSDAMKDLMVAYGAIVVATPTSEARYELINAGVDELGWYPASNVVAPAVGSDAYGIAGYKTIAYEIAQQLEEIPDWLVLPVAYGDCLAGVVQGFTELHAAGIIDRTPRIAAGELFGALEGALSGGPLGPVETHRTAAFSIAGSYTTEQGVVALRDVDGLARSTTDSEIRAARRDLAAFEGIYVEAAAAAPFAVARALLGEGVIDRSESVVCLVTSTGLKDLRPTATDLPVVPPTLDGLRRHLRSTGDRGSAGSWLFGSPGVRS